MEPMARHALFMLCGLGLFGCHALWRSDAGLPTDATVAPVHLSFRQVNSQPPMAVTETSHSHASFDKNSIEQPPV